MQKSLRIHSGDGDLREILRHTDAPWIRDRLKKALGDEPGDLRVTTAPLSITMMDAIEKHGEHADSGADVLPILAEATI